MRPPERSCCFAPIQVNLYVVGFHRALPRGYSQQASISVPSDSIAASFKARSPDCRGSGCRRAESGPALPLSLQVKRGPIIRPGHPRSQPAMSSLARLQQNATLSPLVDSRTVWPIVHAAG